MLNRVLMDLEARKRMRVIVAMPPRSGKSVLVSQYFVAWYAAMNPDHEITIASYEQELAEGFSKSARDILVEHGETMGVFPNPRASGQEWEITPKKHKGKVRGIGIQTGVTGRGAHLLVVDDPVKDAKTSLSPTVREQTWEWFKATAFTRLAPGGVILVVQTRWHHDDLTGRILKAAKTGEGLPFQVLALPAIAEGDRDPLRRQPGEALWPERWPVDKLRQIEKTLGPYFWNALYQQRPTPKGGGIFQRNWFRVWNRDLPDFEMVIQSWDTAFTEKTSNDPSALTVWGVFFHEKLQRHCALLIDAQKGHWNYSELRKRAKRMYETERYGVDRRRADVVLIENQGSGKVLINDLQDGGVPIRPYNPQKASKQQRAHAVSPLVSAGFVYILGEDNPQGIPDWASPFLEEVTMFPMGAEDHFTDTMTQALHLLRDMRQVSVEEDVAEEPVEDPRSYANPYAA